MAIYVVECGQLVLYTLQLAEWSLAGLAAFASSGGLSSLQRLLVSGCPGVGDHGLRAVLDGCLALQDLSAGGCEEVTQRRLRNRRVFQVVILFRTEAIVREGDGLWGQRRRRRYQRVK